jgi:RNA polymerase sigma-70 factor, ECF subfamily
MTANEDHHRLGRPEFEALFTRLEKPIFNVVYRWVWNVEEARDVTQEAFLKLWGARSRVRLEGAEPLVFRAALNLAASRLRARRLRRFFSFDEVAEPVDAAADPHASLDVQQRRAAVRAAVDALPEKLKRVVLLCEFSGLSTAQIAAALQIPPGTVGSRRSLAMAALEQRLGPLNEEAAP